MLYLVSKKRYGAVAATKCELYETKHDIFMDALRCLDDRFRRRQAKGNGNPDATVSHFPWRVYEFEDFGERPKRVTDLMAKEFTEKYKTIPLHQLDLFLENEVA